MPTARGGVQLFMLVGTPAAIRPCPPEPPQPVPSAGLGQLRLSNAAARPAARPHQGRHPRRPADHLRRSQHRELLAAVVGYGQARGWSPSTLRRVQHSLAALLVSQPTLDRPLEAATVRHFLLERGLTARRVVEFLADQGLARVDQHARLDRWLARRLAFANPTAGLAAPLEPPPPVLGLDPTNGPACSANSTAPTSS